MDIKQPLVSCIMPTADRHRFIPHAIDRFLNQDYINTELLILDNGANPVSHLVPNHPAIRYHYEKISPSLGITRNMCCEESMGEIIIHWDDDDWYANDWISKQVDALIKSDADITGLCNINFFSTELKQNWEYKDPENGKSWVYGATLAYRKSFWKVHPFNIMNSGEDIDFTNNIDARIYAHGYIEGYRGIIHNRNKSIRLFENPKEKLRQIKWLKKINGPEKCKKKTNLLTNVDLPLVTCIMPTANRPDFIQNAISNFLNQDYINKELVIIDDGKESIANLIPDDQRIRYYYFDYLGTTGTKRNIACSKANGEMILHWDDDDWYASDWISYEVSAMLASNADICGINQVQFYSPTQNKYWMTKNSNNKRPWLTGASLIYRKSFWEKNPFKALQIGEDDEYIRNNKATIYAHDYYQGFIATLHPNNTSLKFFEDPKTKA